MTFLNHYTYFFSISDQHAKRGSGLLRCAQTRPVKTLQNENLNNQLNAFLKTYKFEKLVTNYKKIQTFIPTNSLNSNKLYAGSAKQNFNLVKTLSHGAENFEKFTYSKEPVLTSSLNNLKNTKVSTAESLLVDHLTYNKFKANLYVKSNKSKSTALKMPSSSNSTNDTLLFLPNMRKTWFKNTLSILQTPLRVSKLSQPASIYNINRALKSPHTPALYLSEADSSYYNYPQEGAKAISRFGTYYFLQKLLSKYLDLSNTDSSHFTLLNNDTYIPEIAEQSKLDFSIRSSISARYSIGGALLDVKIPTQRKNSLYFVFTQLNQKTFLSYWLLPVAGLALLIPPFLTQSTTSVFYPNIKPESYVQAYDINIPESGQFQPLKVPARSVRDLESKAFSTSHQNDLTAIKHCFNNLYYYINNKTELSTKNLFLLSSLTTNAIKIQNAPTFFPVGSSHVTTTNILKNAKTAFSSYLPIHTINSMRSLGSFPYLQAISPIDSKFMIDHSLKFITPKTTLKLLKKKLNKSPKKSYTTTPTLAASRVFLDKRAFRYLHTPAYAVTKDIYLPEGVCRGKLDMYIPKGERSYLQEAEMLDRPLKNYNEALKLIYFYDKKPFGQINLNPTLDFNTLVTCRVNQSNAFQQLSSQIVYKQTLYNKNLREIPGIETKIVNDFTNVKKRFNKNQILLDYFLYSDLLADHFKTQLINPDAKEKITKFKLNLTNTTLPFKTLIKKPLSSSYTPSLMPSLLDFNKSIHFNGHVSPMSNSNLLTRSSVDDGLKLATSFANSHMNKQLYSYLIYLDQNLTKFIQINKNSLQKNAWEKALPVARKGEPLNRVASSKEFLNSLTILFKHQKMFKKKTSKSNKWQLDTKGKLRKCIKTSFNKGNFSKGSEESILSARLHIQKKRKAKKQRLETRRQKKRTRFFPRPVWLRYRMFLNFLTERNKYYLNSYKTFATLPENFLQLQSPKGVVSTIQPIQPVGQTLNKSNFIFNKLWQKSLLKVPVQAYKDTPMEYLERSYSQEAEMLHRFVVNYPTIQVLNKIYLLKGAKTLNTKTSKLSDSKYQNLRDIKIKANYSNFKSQKSNNQPQQNDKDKDKDTIFRDFWVWSYNNTQTNSFNQTLCWLLPNLTTKQSPSVSPTEKNSFPVESLRASKPASAITKMYPINRSHQNLMAISKGTLGRNVLGSASKNQIALIRLNWALNKTNINTFTDYSKRYNLWTTQKLRNQSKNNKTKYLEKQFSTNWEKFFLNKNLNMFSKKIVSKVKQKKQKLNYITSYVNVSSLMQPQLEVLSEQNFKIFNNAWWTHLNLKNLVTNKEMLMTEKEGLLPAGTFNLDFINSAIIKSINKNIGVANSLSVPANEKQNTSLQTNNVQLLFMSSSILLHLCAIISLVSISQVRCFVKFHLILLYKLSNVYNSILNQLSNTLQKKLPVYQNSLGQTNFSHKVKLRYIYRNDPSSKYRTEMFDQNSPTRSQKKLLTYFSFTLLKKQFVKVKSLHLTKLVSPIQVSKYDTNRQLSCNGVTDTNIARINKYSGESLNSKPSKSMYAKLNILSLKTIFLKQLLLNKKPDLSKTTLSSSLSFNSKGELKKSQLVQRIKKKELQISLKKNIIGFSKLAKNQIFKILFNMVEVFQNVVRNISSFFEKPAEFTTTWIAYGFLVEWSSDFITIIPENVDIYIWNVFAKMYRTVPLSFISTTLIPTNQLFHPLTNSTISIKMSSFNYAKMIEFPILLSISHLLHRRILYLFDILFATITQPDADLIARQEKGTLFWDIWADFLVTAADYYNVNVAALSTIKAEQNSLIENISNDFDNLTMSSQKSSSGKKHAFSGLAKNGSINHKTFLINKVNSTTLQKLSIENLAEESANSVKASHKLDRKRTLHGLLDIYAPQEEKLWQKVNFARTRNDDKTSLKLFNQLNLQLFANKNKIKPYFETHFATTQQKTNMDIMQGLTRLNLLQSTFAEGNLNRWSVNQFITYQSWHSHNGSNNSNGDLFIDYHPPKNFVNIPALKYNSILQQPIGSLVCQIYSGIFNRQISKNILLVNPKTTSANLTDYNILLIQALAGETEMKIITDNAQRYALVNRGFAIGIKLLREVFDAIALNTPCIFLLEDIHAIGERRPMLISDYGGGMSDDNGSFKEDFFGSQRDEVHEKNQVVYQLTRHAITHYKKPFKGDYSLAIPTNLYLTDLFLKLPAQSISNLTNVENHNVSIKNKIQNNSIQSLTENKRNLVWDLNKNSYLQITQFTKTLAPPSTSPFSVLLLKEEKKLKPNKIVGELPWTGLPGEQLATKPRTSYSVRAKVAMLAELSLSNLSAKLDMITDLLVIIDSVRSNKGFVVFATTDIPHVLDPALRRPGRLDETICLPNINTSNILNFTKNYEIFKSVKHTSNFSQKIILNQLQNITNSFINFSYPKGFGNLYTSSLSNKIVLPTNKREGLLTMNLKDYTILLNQVVFAEVKGGLYKHSQLKSLNFALISHSKKLKELNFSKDLQGGVYKTGLFAGHSINKQKTLVERNLINSKNSVKKKSKDKASIYYEVGKVVLNYFLNNQLTSVSDTRKHTADVTIFGSDFLNLKTINYLSLYHSKNKIVLQLMLIFGGKISQLLSSKNLVKSLKQNSAYSSIDHNAIVSMYSPEMPIEQHNLLPKALAVLAKPMLFSDGYNNQNLKTATTLLLSFIHKRYLYRKNLIVPKLLSFADGNILDEPPSPPFSSLLIPAKRFENYKRFFQDTLVGDKMGQRKSQITLLEKLQYHMQLRSIKQLNARFSSQGYGDSQLTTTLPSQKFDTLISLSMNNLLQNPTNINWYYQNRILNRHGQYLTNQWWTGQLSEHNAETVFLSDIDWRSSFIKNKNITITKSKNLYSLTQDSYIPNREKNKTDGLDVLLDFPDTDQYYNPKRRRWLLNNGSWSFWFNFDKLYSEEIVTTWILESLIQTYKYLHKNTELLDFVTNKFITLGYMATENNNLNHISGFPDQSELLATKEIILTNSFKRF